MRLKTYVLLLLFLTAFSIGCGNMPAEAPHGSKALDFTLKDINGDEVRLSDHSGKVIMLNFFATWCPPCKAEMPDFNEIQNEYKNDVKIIAVNVGGEALSKVQKFASRNNLTFTIALDDGRVSDLYGPIRGIPVTVIIDKDFNIAKKYVGMRTKEVFVKDIEENLKK